MYGYSLHGIPVCDHRLLVQGKRYSAISEMSLDGIHDVYITKGTVNSDKFADFAQNCLLPSYDETFHLSFSCSR